MNRCDDRTGHLFAADSEEEVRSCAYGRPTRDSFCGQMDKQGHGSIYE